MTMHRHPYEARSDSDPRCKVCDMLPEAAAIADLTAAINELDEIRLEVWAFQGYSDAHHAVAQAIQEARRAVHLLVGTDQP